MTSPRSIYSYTFYTGTFTIDPAAFGVAGRTTFEVVVYDQNENRTHLIYRVNVTRPKVPGKPRSPSAPVGFILSPYIPIRTAMAVTLCRKLEYYADSLEPLVAPPGSNLYVELRWGLSEDDATIIGYRIYRKLDGEPDFRLIYTVNRGTTLYRDSTPDLKVGVPATYRIVAYRWDADAGVAVESDPLEATVTPLPPWDVHPVSPADGASNVPLLPTFTWAPVSPPSGATLIYQIRIWDTPHGQYLITTGPLEGTSWTFPGIPAGPFERLQPHRMYQWQIRGAIAVRDYGITIGGIAISIAANGDTTAPWIGAFPFQAHPELPAFTTMGW